jgi:hypothetical protein
MYVQSHVFALANRMRQILRHISLTFMVWHDLSVFWHVFSHLFWLVLWQISCDKFSDISSAHRLLKLGISWDRVDIWQVETCKIKRFQILWPPQCKKHPKTEPCWLPIFAGRLAPRVRFPPRLEPSLRLKHVSGQLWSLPKVLFCTKNDMTFHMHQLRENARTSFMKLINEEF